MVEISEIVEEEPTQPSAAAAPAAAEDYAAESRSEERLSDADEIECALDHLTRPSARLHLENLITKLRKEGKALQRVAASKAASSSSSVDGSAATEAESDNNNNDSKAKSIPQAPAQQKEEIPIPKRAPATAPILSSNKYQSFPTYYFDAGKYDSATVSVYLPLEGIGTHDKSKITCNFTSSSFDMIVSDYEGKNYRLLNNNLEKDIDVSKTKYVIKPNKIILKLGKVKGEYGFDSWSQLTAKKAKNKGAGKGKKEDPTAGIMDMMKDMYDEGDDNMKKMIGETMMKQRNGQLSNDDMMGGMGMGGMGDMMGGMGGMGL